MSSYKEHRLLNYLDSPKYILYWTLDVAMVFVCLTVLFGVFGHWVKGILLGLLASYLLIKLKKRVGYRRVQHFLYWNVSSSSKLKRTPKSWIREVL